MQRREFLGGLALLVAALATGCSTGGVPVKQGVGSAAAPTLLEADAVRLAAGDPAAARGALLAMSAELFRATAAEVGGNVVLSPHSVATALGMTALGARGATAQAFADLFGLDATELAAVLTTADAVLAAAVAAGTSQSEPEDAPVLESANRLWVSTELAVEQDFLSAVKQGYGAGVQQSDFNNATAVRTEINGWVAERTHDLIPELLPPDALTPLSRLVLVNALYLKANWKDTFHEAATEPGPFNTAAGPMVTTDLMFVGLTTPYRQGDGWQSVRLPFVGGGLAMTVVVPDTLAFEAVSSSMSADFWAEATDGASTEVRLTFPSFRASTSVSLRTALETVGAGGIFAGDADYSGIAVVDGGLVVADVIHQVEISVDENGTEAAAATAVMMEAGAAPGEEKPKPIELVVDRPFLYLIHDVATLTPLFLGQVLDPTKT